LKRPHNFPSDADKPVTTPLPDVQPNPETEEQIQQLLVALRYRQSLERLFQQLDLY